MQRFVAGDAMQTSPRSQRQMTGPALRLAVAFLVLMFIIVSGAHVEGPVAPGQFASQSAVAVKTPDCPNAGRISGHAHCQIATYAIPAMALVLPPPTAVAGSSAWRSGAATSGPITISLRLFRPPILLRAHV